MKRQKMHLASAAAAAVVLGGCGSGSDGGNAQTTETRAAAPAGHLVYHDTADGHTQLFVVGADGRGARQLTRLPGDQVRPAWSPDGSQIVFERDFSDRAGVFVMSADAGKPRRLSRYRFAGGPSFSPDGKWVVFERDPSPHENGITLVPVSGGRPRKVTTNPEHGGRAGGQCGCDGDARFTPDGRQIVFKRTRNDETDSAIFIVGRDGHGLRRLTEWSRSAGQPRVSPDGKRLAFSINSNDNGIANVFAIDLDGRGNRTALTHQRSGGGSGLNGWSRDGRYLSITTDRGGGSAQIWVMRADGSGAHSVTPRASDAHSADWGP